ncbi:LA2681 family HEPN domain-containing protein [Salinivibrio kushneri]|uniref:LA2681 family HEPN domain-containing protein n=1 Tax=Salinivibrio kushneri TaxID=1908198 RepID=UPI000C85FF6F|nr:LA2681 family HEPN domain-containing protein [Salinivibrio kushneri]
MDGWNAKIDFFARNIDTCIESNDIDSLVYFCDELRKIISDESETPDIIKSIITYYLSNIYQHLASDKNERWDNPSYGNAIICHRKFYRYKNKDFQLLPQVEVNHANTLQTLCRTFEAIPLWKKGISHFGDAEEVGLYRLTTGLVWISQYLYDAEHIYYYQLYAYKYAKKLLAKDEIYHNGIRESIKVNSGSEFGRFLQHVQNSFDEESTLSEHPYKPSYSKEEKKYRSWCKDNILFLNPLNDLEDAWIVDHDVLNFPSYSTPDFEGPYLSAAFSSMKNEFCFYRHCFYEGLNKKYVKFTDKDKYLTDTLDGVIYEGYIEKIKVSLKGCFSVLDKTSRLLDRYYELNSSKFAFNRQWFDKQKILRDQNNPFLTALFWLSKDFTQHDDDERRPSYWLNDSAFEVRELRNALEHGWVRVINSDFECFSTWENEHDYAYKITSDALIDKGMYVFKQTRNALIYLCLAINFTEKKSKKENNINILSNKVPLV